MAKSKQKDVILSGFALKSAVRLAEAPGTATLVKLNLSAQLGMDRLFDRDLSGETVGSAITPTRAPFKKPEKA